MRSKLQSLLTQKAIKTLWVAYSGGLDSTVLLHLATQFSSKDTQVKGIQVKAIHIHHGLSTHADLWQQHCQQTCKHLGIPIECIQLESSPKKGESIEAWARSERYNAFKDCLDKYPESQHNAIALAQHQDDQAETFLLQAIRGSGLPGLSAMPEIKAFEHRCILIRPLLSFSRTEILNYAQTHELKWVEDDSNTDTRFSRNFLRHEIMPKLQEKWSQATKTLSRTAQHCAEAQNLLNTYLKNDLQLLITADNSLHLIKLMQKPILQQKALLRLWCQQQLIHPPTTAQVAQIVTALPNASSGWRHSWGAVTIGLYKEKLSLIENSDIHTPLQIPTCNVIEKWWFEKCEISMPEAYRKNLIIRARQPNDTCHLEGRPYSQKLKIIFQEMDIPSWERHKAVIIEVDNAIVAIYPFFVCQPITPK